MEMRFIKCVPSWFIIHFLVADWTAVLAWLATHTLHLHTFHSNSFHTFKLPSAAHFKQHCLIFTAHFHYELGKTVDCPLATRQTPFQFTYLRGCQPQKQPTEGFHAAQKHLLVHSVHLHSSSCYHKGYPFILPLSDSYSTFNIGCGLAAACHHYFSYQMGLQVSIKPHSLKSVICKMKLAAR